MRPCLGPPSTLPRLVALKRLGRERAKRGHQVTPCGDSLGGKTTCVKAEPCGRSPSGLDTLRLGHRSVTLGRHPQRRTQKEPWPTISDLDQVLDQHMVLDLQCLDRIY